MEGWANAATDGPWITVVASRPGHGSSGIVALGGRFVVVTDDDGGPSIPKGADAGFIATARTDLPRLIAHARGLARERDAAAARAEKAEEENADLRAALQVVERRLREDAAPLAALVNAHGGAVERNAWKAVYSSAVHAQGVLKSAALGRTP